MHETLVKAGLPVVDVVFGRERNAPAATPMLWLAVKVDDGATRWVSFESDIVEENLRERFLIATLLLFGLAVGASALIAHRLARPLEALRARIHEAAQSRQLLGTVLLASEGITAHLVGRDLVGGAGDDTLVVRAKNARAASDPLRAPIRSLPAMIASRAAAIPRTTHPCPPVSGTARVRRFSISASTEVLLSSARTGA